ncbi:glycosyltransferase [Rhodococcus hoagii]|nr:glycosyltransferase [Prescottella equi]
MTVGRISAQKDPSFLARVVERVGDPSLTWTWIGDGEPTLKQELIDAGVNVTGWLPNGEALKRMAEADLYFHPARWEGAPMTLLEAVSLGTPVLTREIETLGGLGFASAGADPDGAATAVRRLRRMRIIGLQWKHVRALARHSFFEVQGRALSYVYGVSPEDAA